MRISRNRKEGKLGNLLEAGSTRLFSLERVDFPNPTFWDTKYLFLLLRREQGIANPALTRRRKSDQRFLSKAHWKHGSSESKSLPLVATLDLQQQFFHFSLKKDLHWYPCTEQTKRKLFPWSLRAGVEEPSWRLNHHERFLYLFRLCISRLFCPFEKLRWFNGPDPFWRKIGFLMRLIWSRPMTIDKSKATWLTWFVIWSWVHDGRFEYYSELDSVVFSEKCKPVAYWSCLCFCYCTDCYPCHSLNSTLLCSTHGDDCPKSVISEDKGCNQEHCPSNQSIRECLNRVRRCDRES